MIITWDGRTWDFDPEQMDIQQGIAIFLAWGFTLEGYEEAAEHADPRALQCMYWLMLQQNGIEKPIKECNFDLVPYFMAIQEAQAAEAASKAAAEPEPELGPTPPAGPPSPEPPTPPATTPPPPAPEEASTASSPAS